MPIHNGRINGSTKRTILDPLKSKKASPDIDLPLKKRRTFGDCSNEQPLDFSLPKHDQETNEESSSAAISVKLEPAGAEATMEFKISPSAMIPTGSLPLNGFPLLPQLASPVAAAAFMNPAALALLGILQAQSAGVTPLIPGSPMGLKSLFGSNLLLGESQDAVSTTANLNADRTSEFHTIRPSNSVSPASSSNGGDDQESLGQAEGSGSRSSRRRNYKSMSRERRMEANARERNRVHTIGAAFDRLRRMVPSFGAEQKLSKLSILRITCKYILLLGAMSGEDYSIDQRNYSVSECVDMLSQTIIQESKLKK